jgi:aspartyl-tRNA(Asn)/glutamyl-tRNA(Gln) amidotransferase subunit B
VIVGIEVHAQVRAKSKLFSGSSTDFGNPPNANVSLVDAAMRACCRPSTRNA